MRLNLKVPTSLYSWIKGEAMIEIKIGDCTKRLKDLADNSIDVIICDPPYGVRYLERGWDDLGLGSQQRVWHKEWLKEAYRILKPKGVFKAFSSAKTLHHLIAMMEELGFLDISVEAWVYSSGMPIGNYDIAKGVEATILFGNANNQTFKKLKGKRREDQGKTGYNKLRFDQGTRKSDYSSDTTGAFDLEPQTKEGSLFMGYGTTLKKSWEPICIGFKKG